MLLGESYPRVVIPPAATEVLLSLHMAYKGQHMTAQNLGGTVVMCWVVAPSRNR